MFDITTFGEIMLRFSVPAGTRLQTAAQFDVFPGGAEANVMTALARLGHPCGWHSALPNQALGWLAADHLRAAGIDLSGVVWRDHGRMGTYYVEFAAPPRPIQVIYDRADSCVTQLTPEEVHWDKLLNTQLIHLTGITPALSPQCGEIIQAIVARAHEAGVPISFDINYRQKLWSETEARDWLTPIIQGVDLLLCGQGDAQRVFGIDGTPEAIVRTLAAYSHAKQVVVTLGDQGAVGWNGDQMYFQEALPVQVIDRLGAGDGLAAGVLHGWLAGDLALGLRYGVALAALVLSQRGDAVITTPEEVAALTERTHTIGTVNR